MVRYSLKQLRYFLTAADLKSTSEAARVLHVSQPSISTAIKQLEIIFDQPLMIRHKGQGVTPTPYGREIMDKSRSLLNMANGLQDCYEETPKGLILLGCFIDLSPYYLPNILNLLSQQYSQIRPDITTGELDEIPKLISRGSIDIAITYSVLLGQGIHYQTLQTVAPSALLSAGHPLAQKDWISLKELLNEPFIVSKAPSSNEYLLTVLASRGMVPKVAYNTKTYELQRGMVANRLGVSLVYTKPPYSKSYDGKEVVYRPILDDLPTQDIVLARHEQSELTPATKAVWDLISEQYTIYG